MPKQISHEYLSEILDYNHENGIFTWKKKTGSRTNTGDRAGCSASGYVQIGINYQLYPAHRLAWFMVYRCWPKYFIDHINGDTLDNRISNLRDVPCSQNLQNQRKAQKRSKSGLLGVSFHAARKRWRAQISVGSKNMHIGYFKTAEDAHQAYLAKKRELHIACTI